MDVQQLRRLVLQLVEQAQEAASSSQAPAAPAAAAAGVGDDSVSGSGGGSSGGSGVSSGVSSTSGLEVSEAVVSDPELLALITKRRGGRGPGPVAQRGAKRRLPMSQAERKLRALLKPLALRHGSDE